MVLLKKNKKFKARSPVKTKDIDWDPTSVKKCFDVCILFTIKQI